MKKIVLKYLFVLILATAACFPTKAQLLPKLSIGAQGLINWPDTAQMGDTIDFSYYLVNKGLSVLTNTLVETRIRVNNTTLTTPIASNLLNILNIGDSIQISVNDYIFTPQNHNTGGNAVVIWPGAPNTSPPDTVRDEVYLLEPVNTRRPKTIRTVTAYPNPAQDWLNLDWTTSPAQKLHGRILNYQGQILFEGIIPQYRVPVDWLKPGPYILEIRQKGRPATIIKFIRTE